MTPKIALLSLLLLATASQAEPIDVCSPGMPVPEYYSPESILFSDSERPGLAKLLVEKIADIQLRENLQLGFLGSIQEFSRLQKVLEKNKKVSLVHVGTESYSWQQDRFDVFSSRSGKREIRFVSVYAPETQSRDELIAFAKKRGVGAGAPVQGFGGIKGAAGGNIESLPGGTLVVGSSDFPTRPALMNFATGLAGRPDHTLIAETSWMRLGHIDEVLRLLAHLKPDGACRVHVLVNSPKLALDLLNKNPNEAFYQGIEMPEGTESYLRTLCHLALPATQSCLGIKNLEVVRAIDKSDTNKINKQADLYLDNLAREISESKGPCKMEVIRVPAIYYGNFKDGKIEKASGGAVFPSFTNGVAIENHYIVPLTKNTIFDKYLTEQLSTLGYQVEGIGFDSVLNYGDPATGFLHCATQTFRPCRR